MKKLLFIFITCITAILLLISLKGVQDILPFKKDETILFDNIHKV